MADTFSKMSIVSPEYAGYITFALNRIDPRFLHHPNLLADKRPRGVIWFEDWQAPFLERGVGFFIDPVKGALLNGRQ